MNDFFDSKYETDPEVASYPSTITFFPDISEFEEVDDDPPMVEESPRASTWALMKIGTLQSRIEANQKERDSRFYGGSKDNLARFSAHQVFGLANEVFGYNGWSSSVADCVLVYENIDVENCKFSAKYVATVRVTLKDGTYNEETGTGEAHNLPTRAQCYSKSKKEAVTAGMKRAIIGFRSVLIDEEIRQLQDQYCT
ncbi:DNA repair protein Rad59p [[Candida] anglica]|uniref:DNA repair and recombination protein RAD52 n=1 Tax=[Candida] anglica TaxID=148631 RepID=A0ABP0EM74_9ASCO